MEKFKIHIGSALDVLKTMADKSVNCCVTSPPYWALRDYGVKGQLGLEPSPEEYVAKLVEIFREVRRVLRDDGTLWLNLGDSYAGSYCGGNFGLTGSEETVTASKKAKASYRRDRLKTPRSDRLIEGIKPKDMVGIPWMVAFALRSDGWYLRADLPWLKRNGMPGSEKDRPPQTIDHIFLLSKSKRYYYDFEAVEKLASPDTHARYVRGRSKGHKWADGGPGNQTIAKGFAHMGKKPHNWGSSSKYHGQYPADKRLPGVNPKSAMAAKGSKQNPSFSESVKDVVQTRMRRSSDWFFESFQGLVGDEDGNPLAMIANTKGYKGAHFATFPPAMVEPCILAGCPEGGVVLDTFTGSGTTGRVALKNFRRFEGIELNKTYAEDMIIPSLEAEAMRHKQLAII